MSTIQHEGRTAPEEKGISPEKGKLFPEEKEIIPEKKGFFPEKGKKIPGKENPPTEKGNISPHLAGGMFDTPLDEYILAHITPEDEYLHRLWRATNLHLLRPRMASGHLQGLLLRMLTRLIRPHTVLEIGTYSGYSALCMAAALTPDDTIYTYEINDEQEDFTRPWLENSPYPGRIVMTIGDVMELLPQTDLTFDMAFIDANKRQYTDYYNLVMDRLNPGGYILADNTLWDGHVVDSQSHDAQTEGIRLFNDTVAADPRVEKIILPLRDGLTIIRKK